MSIVDCITSFVDGRVRLRHPALKDKATAELVCTVVGGVEGITAVQANPLTGSLLIYYDAEKLTREQLLDLAEQGAAFVGFEHELRPVDPAGAQSCGMSTVAQQLTALEGIRTELFDVTREKGVDTARIPFSRLHECWEEITPYQQKTALPAEEDITLTADEGRTALGRVTVPSAAGLRAENIREGTFYI